MSHVKLMTAFVLLVWRMERATVSSRLVVVMNHAAPTNRKSAGVLRVGGIASVLANHKAFHTEARYEDVPLLCSETNLSQFATKAAELHQRRAERLLESKKNDGHRELRVRHIAKLGDWRPSTASADATSRT